MLLRERERGNMFLDTMENYGKMQQVNGIIMHGTVREVKLIWPSAVGNVINHPHNKVLLKRSRHFLVVESLEGFFSLKKKG